MRVLFLTQGPIENASARYRVWQFVPWLEACGVECRVHPAVSSERRDLLLRRSIPERLELLARTICARILDVISHGRYDVIVFQREVFVRIYPLFESLVAKLHGRIVFDFDDFIFANPHSSRAVWYRLGARLIEDRAAPQRIVALSSQVIAGSGYLAEVARSINPRVTMIPTSVDTKLYEPKRHAVRMVPTIGWIGSSSSSHYLSSILPALEDLSKTHRFRLLLIGAAEADARRFSGLPLVEVRPWSLASELSSIAEMDIGVMPLVDDAWARGKCGFKAIQYMAMGIPAVCSPIGANAEIIDDGLDGFLPSTRAETVRCLADLLDNVDLRGQVGLRARDKVELRYSLVSNAPKLLRVLEQAALEKGLTPQAGGG